MVILRLVGEYRVELTEHDSVKVATDYAVTKLRGHSFEHAEVYIMHSEVRIECRTLVTLATERGKVK